MPKISRAARKPTKPGDVKPEKEKLDKYICTRCGKIYKHQKGNFPASQSPLHKGNGGYMPVCNRCMDDLYEHYKDALGSGKEAIHRICMKMDIYWTPEAYNMINKANTSTSRVRSYISKTFLNRFIGKTYDDTLDEGEIAEEIVLPLVPSCDMPDVEDEVVVEEHPEEQPESSTDRTDVSPDTIIFWGSGFDNNTYAELDMRFNRWTKDLPKPLPIVEESIYKQICIQEVMINRNIILGRDIEKGQSTLNSLLSSLNVKPNQQKKEDNTELENTPLGVWTKRWEEKRPIPEDDPDMEDVHGIKKYISVWFYGHLCKALGLKNIYSELYEREINKYRVTKPEFEDEDDEAVITDVFGDHGGDSG